MGTFEASETPEPFGPRKRDHSTAGAAVMWVAKNAQNTTALTNWGMEELEIWGFGQLGNLGFEFPNSLIPEFFNFMLTTPNPR